MYRPETIILGALPESGGYALCIDTHGHGLYIPNGALHDALDTETRAMLVLDDGVSRAFLGDPLAELLSALASVVGLPDNTSPPGVHAQPKPRAPALRG